MSYKHGTRKNRYFDGKLRNGVRQMCTFTPDKRLSDAIEHMWHALAVNHRAWDLLQTVLDDPKSIGTLYDLWIETNRNVEAMRRRQADVDLSTVVDEWFAIFEQDVTEGHAQNAKRYVRFFFPEGVPRLVSQTTTEWLTKRLAEYKGKRNTRRRVHSALSEFLKYVTVIKRGFAANPMLFVERPKAQSAPIRFYESEQVEQIVRWQPTLQRQALMALQYGAAIEISVTLQLERGDFNPAERDVRAAGTKTHTRDRVSLIADWAWPIVWEYIKDMLPGAKLFDGVTRSGANFWHRQAITNGLYSTEKSDDSAHSKLVKPSLGLSKQYPLHNARHHWAVRFFRAGGPVEVAQRQLGHSSPTITLKTYGPFMPGAADRKKWERAASKHDAKRRASPLPKKTAGKSGVPDTRPDDRSNAVENFPTLQRAN